MPRRHEIPNEAPPIVDAMTMGAPIVGLDVLVGRSIVTVYEIPDSDRDASLLLLDDGTVVLLSCAIHHGIIEGWECYAADATSTAAGQAMLGLKHGYWS